MENLLLAAKVVSAYGANGIFLGSFAGEWGRLFPDKNIDDYKPCSKMKSALIWAGMEILDNHYARLPHRQDARPSEEAGPTSVHDSAAKTVPPGVPSLGQSSQRSPPQSQEPAFSKQPGQAPEGRPGLPAYCRSTGGPGHVARAAPEPNCSRVHTADGTH